MTTIISKLIISIIICLLAGGVGSIINIDAISGWYSKLKKPKINPPNKIFGPVWTALYILMGISLFLVWSSGYVFNSIPIVLFSAQLLLNVIWSGIFFGAKKPLLAFIEIIFLWIFILLTIIAFFPISIAASILLFPYLLWVSFAAILNFYIWKMNRKNNKK